MKHRKVATRFILAGIIVAVVLLYMFVFRDKPKVAIRCSRDQAGRLIVNIEPDRQVHHLYSVNFRMEGDDEDMWKLRETLTPIRHVVYGEVPHEAIQSRPTHDVPPKPIPKSGILYVEVVSSWYRYIPPAYELFVRGVKLQLTEDGGVKYLGEIDYGY